MNILNLDSVLLAYILWIADVKQSQYVCRRFRAYINHKYNKNNKCIIVDARDTFTYNNEHYPSRSIIVSLFYELCVVRGLKLEYDIGNSTWEFSYDDTLLPLHYNGTYHKNKNRITICNYGKISTMCDGAVSKGLFHLYQRDGIVRIVRNVGIILPLITYHKILRINKEYGVIMGPYTGTVNE